MSALTIIMLYTFGRPVAPPSVRHLDLALTALLASTRVGPLATQESLPFARVEILNTPGEAGKTLADVVLPLAMGAARAVPMLATGRGELCQVPAMGPPWRDGSLRDLEVELPVSVTAHERRGVRLFVHHGAPPRLRVHPAVVLVARCASDKPARALARRILFDLVGDKNFGSDPRLLE